MRIYTCTPVDFDGSEAFFSRDSGLLSRGLQSIGVESMAVMAGMPRQSDEPDLIRTEYSNLESSDWWSALHLDAVVLYAWGRPRFRKVAASIKKAGIFLILNQDNGGLISPLAGFSGWATEQRQLTGGGFPWVVKLISGMSYGIGFTDPLRAAHLRHGDVIACVSPKAAERYLKLCRWYGGAAMSRKVRMIPHAVEADFRYNHQPKTRQLACVGRWDDVIQKRPMRLMEVIGQLIRTDDSVSVVIAGTSTTALRKWHEQLGDQHRKRVELLGKVSRKELVEILNASQVFYSSSAFESFGIAAAEALCCGCSVVAGRSVSMASFEWFVSENSGRLVESDTPANDVTAIMTELRSWQTGDRDAVRISRIWRERLHAPNVAKRVVELMDRSHPAKYDEY